MAEVTYDEYLAELRRHTILRFLVEFPNNRGNDDVLQMALVEDGQEAAHEEVSDDLRYLAQEELVRLTKRGDYTVAALTRRGSDVAAGRLSVSGIRRHLPRRI